MLCGMKLSSCSCGQGAAHRRVDGPNSLRSPQANPTCPVPEGTKVNLWAYIGLEYPKRLIKVDLLYYRGICQKEAGQRTQNI